MQPGQYVHASEPARRGLLPAVLPVAGFERAAGTLDLLVPDPASAAAGTSIGALQPGERARLDGPLGRGFAIDARSRFLLVVCDGGGIGRVRAIVDEALATGRHVTLLFGAASVADVFPSSLLRDEVEYIVATRDGSLGHRGQVADLVPEYEAWADQCFVAGSDGLVSAVRQLAGGRDARMGVARLGRRRKRGGATRVADARRRSWLQVALAHEVGCVLGICLGCVIQGARGPLRVCREGPVFASDELSRGTL